MKKLFLCIFLFVTLLAFPQLKINEIMTNNVSAVWDDAYNFSMWVELYNPGTSPVNQSAYYFTDDLNQPRKWQPPAVFVPAKGYNTLWFEKFDRPGHSNFRLQPEGGALYLLSSTGAIIDYVVYPAQNRNISYGRKTDGADEWVFFEQHSKGITNNGKIFATERCVNPKFTVPGGLYSNGINVRFQTPSPGDTIYYVLTQEEPTRTNSIRYTPGNVISVTSTTIIRAKAFGAGKLSSDVVTSTYLIGQRKFNLPVVSIVTPQAYLTDNTVGIYVTGTNGIPGNGTNNPANWNQDWDRPANFELFDTTNTVRLNQELDIQIAGGWTRTMNPQKSLHIQPKKKFNNNKLDYDIFAATKPNRKYKDIMLRNSGNDFGYSMLRDGFMQSLVIKRMDIDAIAYEPAVCFMNGVYYGIQNLRERSNADFIYSNYGYSEEEVLIIDQIEIPNNPQYLQMLNFITNNDITIQTVYNQLCEMMEVDSYIDYMITQIFTGNYDWPHNNIKMWKKIDGGKWRWILFDLDFGFNLYDTNLHNFNALTYALGESSSRSTQPWATALFKRLVENPTFRSKLIDKFSIHLSSTFETTRINKVLDSVAAKITNEIVYHKTKWGSSRTFSNDISIMKNFSANRANVMFNHLSARFMNNASLQTANISSNIPQATYLMNGELIRDANINLRSYSGRILELKANPVKGYDFKHWEIPNATSNVTLIGYDSEWKYWDNNGMPAANWFSSEYQDTSWKTGQAPLGYGNSIIKTTIGFGGNSSNKYPTAYFRKTINIDKPSDLSNIILTVFVDDGAAAYVNGTEVGRFNLPAGTLNFNTLTSTFNNGEYSSFTVPAGLLKQGENLIAVEVHQVNATSSDLIFNLQITADSKAGNTIVKNPAFSTSMNQGIQLIAIYEENNQPDPSQNATLVINEIVSSNNVFKDEFGERDDYIEIYNHGTKEVNIAGWYLSDTPGNPRLTQIPTTDSTKTAIPPGGFLVIWCDDAPHQGVLHVNFKLSKDGETVSLAVDDKFGNLHIIDTVVFPFMEQNLSYSRVPDGSNNWNIQIMTPGGTNQLTDYQPSGNTSARVYPAQVTSDLHIAYAEGKIIRIADMTGRIILQQQLFSNLETIDMRWYQPGIYLVNIDGETFRIIRK